MPRILQIHVLALRMHQGEMQNHVKSTVFGDSLRNVLFFSSSIFRLSLFYNSNIFSEPADKSYDHCTDSDY